MAKSDLKTFSTSEATKRARTIIASVLKGLEEAGIPAVRTSSGDGIKFKEAGLHPYNIMSVTEVYRGSTWQREPSGKLEIRFITVYLSEGRMAARTLKEDSKDLEKKVIQVIKQRYEALVADKGKKASKRAAEDKLDEDERELNEEFPEESRFLSTSGGAFVIEIEDLRADQVRAIFNALRTSEVNLNVDFGDEE